jgi:type IV pilus assembly protein PilM
VLHLFKKAAVVGLEIDAGEVRAVELQGTPAAPTLTAWGILSLPPAAVVEGVMQPDVIGQVLKELWFMAGFSSDKVLLGVDNQGVMVRFADFPVVPDNRVASMVKYQAQEHIPVPLSEVVLDHAVIGETTDDSGPRLEVLLVAGLRDMLDTYLKAMTISQLQPLDIDVTPLALLRLLPESNDHQTVLMVNVGSELSSIVVVEQGLPRLVRLAPTGLREAAALMACSLDEVLTEVGNDPPVSWPDKAFRVWYDNLSQEVVSSLNYYQKSGTVADVSRVIISGRGARVDGLLEQLQEDLELAVEILDPLENIRVPARLAADLIPRAPGLAVCISLARRGLKV